MHGRIQLITAIENMQDDQSDSSLQRITLLMVLLNAFTTPLMLSAVNVALPAIAIDLSMNAVLLS